MLHRCPWCQRLEPTWEAVTQELHVKYPESDGRLRFAKARSQTECACVDLFGQSARVKRSSRCSVCNPGYLEVSACFAGSPVKPSVLNSRHQAWSQATLLQPCIKLPARQGGLAILGACGWLACNGAEQPSHGLRAQVDCVQQAALCREHHITGFPSIRVFRSGHDDITVHGMRDHEVAARFYH